LNTDELHGAILSRAPAMAEGLADVGYYSTTDFLPGNVVSAMRDQSVGLRRGGRFEQSWSEKIVAGASVRFDKEGVYACEPDGQDYYDAPDLLTYMSVLLQALPPALNGEALTASMELSTQSFNAKLAVTSPGGSKYPLHIDNPQGVSVGDTRKLTCILYLNPDYQEDDGGELRIFLEEEDGTMGTVDLTPEGGRLLLFWSDEIPHEVLPTAPHGQAGDEALDRYALTVWIPSSDVTALHKETSKFSNLKDLAFP